MIDKLCNGFVSPGSVRSRSGIWGRVSWTQLNLDALSKRGLADDLTVRRWRVCKDGYSHPSGRDHREEQENANADDYCMELLDGGRRGLAALVVVLMWPAVTNTVSDRPKAAAMVVVTSAILAVVLLPRIVEVAARLFLFWILAQGVPLIARVAVRAVDAHVLHAFAAHLE